MRTSAEIKIKSSGVMAVISNQDGRVGEVSWPKDQTANLEEIVFLDKNLWTLVKMALGIRVGDEYEVEDVLNRIEVTSETPGDEALGQMLVQLMRASASI